MITDLRSLKVSCHTNFRVAEREAQCILSEFGPLNWKMYCDDHSSPSPSVELFNEEEQETKTTTSKCSVKATYIVEFVVFQKD